MQQPIDIARAVLSNQPFTVLLGAELTAFADDAVELRLPVTEKLKQHHGFVHGGVLAYLADNALTLAGALSMGGGVLTADLKMNYLRPAIGDLLIARAHSLSHGHTQGVCRCDIFIVKDGDEKLCVAAQGAVLRSSVGREVA